MYLHSMYKSYYNYCFYSIKVLAVIDFDIISLTKDPLDYSNWKKIFSEALTILFSLFINKTMKSHNIKKHILHQPKFANHFFLYDRLHFFLKGFEGGATSTCGSTAILAASLETRGSC